VDDVGELCPQPELHALAGRYALLVEREAEDREVVEEAEIAATQVLGVRDGVGHGFQYAAARAVPFPRTGDSSRVAPMGALIGLGVFVACLAAGAALLGTGHIIIGIVVLLLSIPGAIVAWMKWADRGF
jgi:hypothetical protein